MPSKSTNVTPTSALLPHVLHALSRGPYAITLLTRQTSNAFSFADPSQSSTTCTYDHGDHGSDRSLHHHHGPHNATITHHHDPPATLTHVQTDFACSSLPSYLADQSALLLLLTGSDLSLSRALVTTAHALHVPRILPSEFGLDTSSAAVRALLPPYQSRWEIQQLLSRLSASAREGVFDFGYLPVYAGVSLREAVKTSGVLGVDADWGSVSTFEAGGVWGAGVEAVVSRSEDVAAGIVKVLEMGEGEWRDVVGMERGVFVSSFRVGVEELVGVLERVEGKGRVWSRYVVEGEAIRREARERMARGMLDSGVGLLERVVVGDPEVGAWEGWLKDGGKGNKSLGIGEGGEGTLEEAVAKVMDEMKNSGVDKGCGC